MVRCHLVPTCRDVDTIWLNRQREQDEYRKRVEAEDTARHRMERRKRELAQHQELLERDRQIQLQANQYQPQAGRVPPYSGPGKLRKPISPYSVHSTSSQRSLKTTTADENDTDDDYCFDVVPPVRISPALLCTACGLQVLPNNSHAQLRIPSLIRLKLHGLHLLSTLC